MLERQLALPLILIATMTTAAGAQRTGQYANVNGLKIYYERHGPRSEKSPPVTIPARRVNFNVSSEGAPMARYVDGFVIPVPKRNLATYRRQAARAGKIWREHGALEHVEAVGDDLKVKGILPFPRTARAKPGETVVFSWIVYKSRAHRDRVNAKVMKDPRILKMMNAMPFDGKRMTYGGFKVVVDL